MGLAALGAAACGSDEFDGNDGASGRGSGGSAGRANDAGEGGDGGAGQPGPVACPEEIDGLAQAFATAVCRKRVECCDDDYETCVAEVADAMDDIYPNARAAVQEGTASLACSRFDACAAAIDAADCSEWPLQVGTLAQIPVDEPACRELVTPRVPAGEACSANYECIDGACSSDDGVCHAYAAENAPCEAALCELPTMFCNAAGVCQRRLENGVTCTDDNHCESGLCDADDSGVCVAPGPNQCRYVPAAPATCSLSGVPGGSSSSSVPLLMLVALAASGLLRRRPRAISR